jgi:hypothetical protein
MDLLLSLHSSSCWYMTRWDQRPLLPCLFCKPWLQTLSSRSHRLATRVFSSTSDKDSPPWPKAAASEPVGRSWPLLAVVGRSWTGGPANTVSIGRNYFEQGFDERPIGLGDKGWTHVRRELSLWPRRQRLLNDGRLPVRFEGLHLVLPLGLAPSAAAGKHILNVSAMRT